MTTSHQAHIFERLEEAPGGGYRLHFRFVNGAMPLALVVDKENARKIVDALVPYVGHGECDDECPCKQAGYETPREPLGV